MNGNKHIFVSTLHKIKCGHAQESYQAYTEKLVKKVEANFHYSNQSCTKHFTDQIYFQR